LKISERIKSLSRRPPPTAEELAARAEAESMRSQIRHDEAVLRNQVEGRIPGSSGPP
jgi:DNA-binding ferritin-like protein